MNEPLQALPSLESIANLMTRVGLLETQIEDRKKDEEYFSNISPVALGLFRIVVMGEIKKGKSSFINALCGINGLVPVHDDVATSTIFKIHYGAERNYSVFFLPEANKTKVEIPTDQLNLYGTEDGNPDNEKKVDFIGVAAPSPVLNGGFVIVDTPGVGGLFKKHRQITFRYAPKADAVFFITDSTEAPIGADEISFLKELRGITPLIYFVQTKGADADVETRKRRMANNIAILTEKAGFPKEEIRYFVVDSKIKSEADAAQNLEDLQDSGFAPLMAYLNNTLKPARDRNIATVGVRRAWMKLAEIRAAVDQQRLVLDADTAEKQQGLTYEINATESKLAEWNNNTRPQLIKNFQIEAQSIQSDILSLLSDKLRPGGVISEAMGDILARTKDAQPEEIYLLAQPLADQARSQACELMLEISKQLDVRFVKLLENLAVNAGVSMSSSYLTVTNGEREQTEIHFAEAQLRELVARGKESHLFERVRTGLYGGMAGVAIASIAGGIIGSVVPVIGTMIGSTFGMLIAGAWGGAQAGEIVRSKEASAARQSVHTYIEKDLSGIHAQVQAGFNKTFNAMRLKAEDAVAEMVKTSMGRMSTVRSNLKARMQSTSQEINQAKQKVVILQSHIDGFARELDAMDKSLK